MQVFFFKHVFSFIAKKKEKIIRISLGLFLVLGSSLLLFIAPQAIAPSVSSLENFEYDWRLKHVHKSLSSNTPITIVDIDDQSLNAIGRWPWPRSQIANLVKKLYEKGAAVVAFDIIFPQPEKNIAEEVLQKIPQDSVSFSEIRQIKESFNYDAQFAKALTLGTSILGIVFTDQEEKTSDLPPPLLQLTKKELEQLAIPDKQGYLANISELQTAAKTAGFINAVPDSDGVLRFTPLLFRNGANVYGSLALQAVSLYLLTQKVSLFIQPYNDQSVLEGIWLDQLLIPVDPTGKILIPYRGLPFSFPYISAEDVLNDTVLKESLNGKLIFIGSTASAMGDNHSSAIAPVFPGIEIHATVASGIIDHYLPNSPTWGKGVTLLLMIILGMASALILPFLNIFMMCLLTLFLSMSLVLLDHWTWIHQGIVISIAIPLALILILFLVNMIWGYLFESLRGKEITSIFGQYVPPAYLENMLKHEGEFNLEGESKELSVLFSDIRDFTNLSEKMNASELKFFLNRYFNTITETIFKHQGTIDKYVGDMVMAFWGAPLQDPKHAFNAVCTALYMQEELSILDKAFAKEQKPEIKIGIGINTGVMNVGDMGSKFRRSYTVLGDSVNLASRLEGQTKFYHVSILVGKSTYLQTQDEFVYRKIDKIKVKGKDLAVEIFNPICRVEDSSLELQTELEIHHKALEAYFKQDWKTSENLFQQLQETYLKNKPLYAVYLDRIEHLKKTPLQSDWDGAFVSLEK